MRWRFTLDSASYGTLVLADEPIGWADVVQTFKRDKDWHGIFFDFTLSLKFWGQGHAYVRNVYENIGIDEYVELLVEIACSDTDGFEEFYRGKLLMAKYKEVVADHCEVEVPIDPAGCLMQFRNRIDQAVNLDSNQDFDNNPLTAYSGLNQYITLLPKSIVKRTLSTIGSTNSLSSVDNQIITSGTGTAVRQSLSFYSIPIDTFTLAEVNTVNSTPLSWNLSTPAPLPTQMVVSEPGTYQIDYRYPIEVESWALTEDNSTEPQGCSWGAYSPAQWEEFTEWELTFVIELNGTITYTNVFESRTSDCIAGHKNWSSPVSGSLTIALSAGDSIRASIRVKSTGEWDRNIVFNRTLDFHNIVTLNPALTDTYFNVHAVIQNPATQCRAYLINESFSRTVESITNDCLRVYSDYFGRTDAEPYSSPIDGCGSLEAIFKGLHARQFPANRVLMALSFKDLFEAMNAVHCIGIGIEPDVNRPGNDLLRIEPMNYWYDDSTIILSCDNVPEIRRASAPEMYLSLFQFGYEKWEAENSMGLDEFCTKREFRSTRKEIKNTVSRQCKFIASGYAIEVTRNIHYTADSTKDWRWDNDTFLLCVRRDGSAFAVEQGIDCADTSTMTDIIDPPSIYNYRISPIRNMMRWSQYLFATYFPSPAGPDAKFIFNSGEGNFLVKGKLINGCIEEITEVAENDDIDVNVFSNPDHATPLFCPATDEFEYPVAWQTIRAWRLNPSLLRGVIRYRHFSSDPWAEGYVVQIQYKPNEGKATFTVLPKFS